MRPRPLKDGEKADVLLLVAGLAALIVILFLVTNGRPL